MAELWLVVLLEISFGATGAGGKLSSPCTSSLRRTGPPQALGEPISIPGFPAFSYEALGFLPASASHLWHGELPGTGTSQEQPQNQPLFFPRDRMEGVNSTFLLHRNSPPVQGLLGGPR